MKLMSDSGLWSTGPVVAPSPLQAVLEISGAVLSWTVDEPAADPQITFTDLSRADWLWQVLGESGHHAVASAVGHSSPDDAQSVDLTGVHVLPGSLDPLRRLAFGHWLRRWWPTSHRDGIAALDAALLDAEIAILTAGAEDFFTDDTFDSDVAEILRPHVAALGAHVHEGDPRIVELVEKCADLADEVGIAFDTVAQPSRRDDYALAAGGETGGTASTTVASGAGSVQWSAVPAGIFDAAEDTVDWSIEAADDAATASVRVELAGLGSPNGIAVRLRSGPFEGEGELGADGRAEFPLVDAEGQPLSESAAWGHDWRHTSVVIGADVGESVETRERVRDFARSRLAAPGADAFLAEILAAESDY
ncbi:hypothetical protein H7J93_10010 [Mycobacterium barrassiae]|uniref:hypothetical protein n=1 Tax=Mycobacterium barrassiae TaxID=319709 RepID=UPI002265D8B0|nr:hypothetical protein [Mycobacterium barrassiae]MCV7299967.1 hypothetical protein [Mycobacterium barrassiae]